jgi:hypothetical protein
MAACWHLKVGTIMSQTLNICPIILSLAFNCLPIILDIFCLPMLINRWLYPI